MSRLEKTAEPHQIIITSLVGSAVLWGVFALACYYSGPPQYSPGRTVIVNVNQAAAPSKPKEATYAIKSGTGAAPTIF